MTNEEGEKWRSLAISLIPEKPDENAHDGPCCYKPRPLSTGKVRYISQGCYCGNYDDAQAASSWAEDMNRRLDALEEMQRLGLKCPGIEIEPGVWSGCDQSGGDCPTCDH